MGHATDRIADALAAPFRRGARAGWTWRHVLTVLLLLITLPVFLVAAAVAAVVAAPLLVIYGMAQALHSFHDAAEPRRPLLLR
jgi:hypothetical protein